MNKIIIKSCAKINIGLNITGKRPDGYHNIETIFYPVNIFDELIFEKSDNFKFTCSDKNLEQDKSNLIIKAKNILEDYCGKIINVKIKLEKNIPIGAGLGGGSSNCAVTLLSLNELFNLEIDNNIIKEIALKLGSDVPFFLNPKPSFATSRGEILKETNLKINLPILIVNPGIHISTKWAFENLNLYKQECPLEKIIENEEFIIQNAKGKITNDFEEIVFEKYPEIKNVKKRIYDSGALFSLMTGTGSTVFGIFSTMKEAINAQKTFNNFYSIIHYDEN